MLKPRGMDIKLPSATGIVPSRVPSMWLAIMASDRRHWAEPFVRDGGVLTDYRGDLLRLGPAPYLSDKQLEQTIGILGELVD